MQAAPGGGGGGGGAGFMNKEIPGEVLVAVRPLLKAVTWGAP